jgi:ribose transport system permease protein
MGDAAAPGASMGRQILQILRDNVTFIVFGLVTIYFILTAPNFATLGTAEAVLRITAIVSIMAVGMTFVIIAAEIDLSVGSMASLSGMIGALLLQGGLSWEVAVVLTLLFGIAVGAISGLLVTILRIPSFLVTLGMLSVLSGVALTITDTRPVPIISNEFANFLWEGTVVNIPAPIVWTFGAAVAGFYVLHLTPLGKRVFATGGNAVAARFSGVRTGQIKLLAFMLSGFTASFAGLMLAARSTAGNPSLGSGLELDVIAAVIIGGTSLFGGRGGIIGSVIGAIFIGVVGFGLLVLGFSTSIQEIIKGAIIIGAVAVARR